MIFGDRGGINHLAVHGNRGEWASVCWRWRPATAA